ncbi:MAG: TetR family transcriptional regulator, partial [Verrucomicrobiae bacterium]|nr:TetR family transcriptional regulator [Verrucomicrobiae bacterium]
MKKPNARERILETAARLFQERGFSEVGINEI